MMPRDSVKKWNTSCMHQHRVHGKFHHGQIHFYDDQFILQRFTQKMLQEHSGTVQRESQTQGRYLGQVHRQVPCHRRKYATTKEEFMRAARKG